MRGVSRITYLWPGLSRLWHHGDLTALGTAIAFAVLLNLMLLASFVRPEGTWNTWYGYGWAMLVAFWAFGVWQAARHQASSRDLPQVHNQQDLFIRAQAEYLRGRWVEAQSLLEQLIRRSIRGISNPICSSRPCFGVVAVSTCRVNSYVVCTSLKRRPSGDLRSSENSTVLDRASTADV